jgi:hypothetical protein
LRPVRPGQEYPVVTLFGGTSLGWRCLLATLGVSALASGVELTVINLSDKAPEEWLVEGAGEIGKSTRQDRLSTAAPTLDVFADLARDELLDDIIAALGTGQRDEESLAQEKSLLRRVYRKLRDPVTVPRLAAAMRLTIREDGPEDALLLDGQELADLMSLFGEEVRSRGGLTERLAVLAERVSDLARFSPAEALSGFDPPDLHVISVDRAMGDGDFDLAVALLTQRVLRDARAETRSAALTVILGADRLRPRVVESLTALSFGRPTRTLLCFTHLNDQAEGFLGADNSCAIFMRLANAKEAEIGARHVGNEFKFVLSETSVTRGTSLEHATGTGDSTEIGSSKSSGFQSGFSRTLSEGRSRSTSTNFSSGRNESFAESMERVHELVIEPERLQDLEESALILVEHVGGQRRMRLLDCHPSIAVLPRVGAH